MTVTTNGVLLTIAKGIQIFQMSFLLILFFKFFFDIQNDFRDDDINYLYFSDEKIESSESLTSSRRETDWKSKLKDNCDPKAQKKVKSNFLQSLLEPKMLFIKKQNNFSAGSLEIDIKCKRFSKRKSTHSKISLKKFSLISLN